MGMFDPNITWSVDGQEIDPASRSMLHPNPAFQGQNLRKDVYSNMWANTTGYGDTGEQVPMLSWLQNYAEQNNIPININQLNPENPNDKKVLDAWNKNQAYYRSENFKNKRQESQNNRLQALEQAGVPLELIQNPEAQQQISSALSLAGYDPYTSSYTITSEQYPQDLLDLGYSQEIIDEYDHNLLRTLDGLMPWEVPGAEYQGYGNPYSSWWGGGSIPMDDPRRAEAARALYERTGTLYTPFGDSNPTLQKRIQDTVDRINKQGQFRFGDDWETYYFDPLKFLDISLTGDRGQADYSQFQAALTQDIQDYYQQYDPESLNWRDEAISEITIDRYQNKGETYEDYLADRTNPPKTPQQSTRPQEQNNISQSGPRDYVGLPQSPYANMSQNTMFGQNQASQQVTQSSLLNNLSRTINSQRANILKNLFGM